MNDHIPWPKIKNWANLQREYQSDLASGSPVRSTVQYRPKLKLHGTNASIVIKKDGDVYYQSRNRVITPEKDNQGFAAWADSNFDRWIRMIGHEDMVIYGEWCGHGIQKGTSANLVREKFFAVFAIGTLWKYGMKVEADPGTIEARLGAIDGAIVLPWVGDVVDVDISERADVPHIELMSAMTGVCESDAFIEENFGVTGGGEGVVCYPALVGLGKSTFSKLAFKIKGEKFEESKSRKKTEKKERPSGVSEFCDRVVTEPRLEKFFIELSCCSILHIAVFSKTVIGDIKEECVAELSEHGLEWKDVKRDVSRKVHSWYKHRLDKTE